ncbi:unnamed protein product [Linum trigynum]
MRIEESGTWRLRVPGATSVFFDNTSSPRYNWLLPGCLVEEQTMPDGKIHLTYYDHLGRVYASKCDLLRAWEQAGVQILDPKFDSLNKKEK